MKKSTIIQSLILTFLLFFTVATHAQKVNNVPLEDIQAKYIQLRSQSVNPFNGNVKVALDYGQEQKSAFSSKERIIMDDFGDVVFHSIIEALNLMNRYGYEVKLVYSHASDGTSREFYLLEKIE